MAHFDCGWTCGCAGKTARSLENKCHTWALLRWWFTTKRRYIMCMHLYTYIYLPLPLAWVRLENQRPVTCYVTVTLMTFDMQSNGRRIEVESYSCKHGVSNSFPAGTRTPDPQRPQVAQPAAVLAIVPCVHFADHAALFIDPRTASAVFIASSDRQLSHRRMHSVRQSRRTGTTQAWQILPTEWMNEWRHHNADRCRRLTWSWKEPIMET